MSLTQEEIIRMMKEAGFYIGKDDEFHQEWERFSALVASHEREACAKVCEPVEGSAYELGVYKTMQTLAAAVRARSEQ